MAYQVQSVGSISPFLVVDLGIDYATLGTLIGLYMLPGVVIALPGGVLGQRFGDTRMCLLSLALMTLGGVLQGVEIRCPVDVPVQEPERRHTETPQARRPLALPALPPVHAVAVRAETAGQT